MIQPLYKRYYFFEKYCELTHKSFKGWGYRYLEGPYFSNGNGIYGNWKYINGSVAETKSDVRRLIKEKQERERMEVIKRRADRYPSPPKPPKPRKINERKYHPIKK